MRFLAFFFVLALLTGCASTPIEYDGSRYQLITGTYSWKDAKAQAEAAGGYLAVLSSPEEYVSVTSQLPERMVLWIGLSDAEEEGRWQWVDGTPLRVDMISNLRVGRLNPERDYAHITLQRRLASRENSGLLPMDTSGRNWVEGYLIEFD